MKEPVRTLPQERERAREGGREGEGGGDKWGRGSELVVGTAWATGRADEHLRAQVA